jgi:secreted trypsin-like serine protease
VFLQGDSGGPLVCEGVVYGVASMSRKASEKPAPGAYVNVAKFIDWIKANTGI